ncbi:hypothetical protein [Streptomyces sp. NPDC088739]|uniref:hypothetical protein n=1 Tax=Streptomyces sp. NPDC088739 TaxID=3365882 RepID=UPI00382A9379
MSRKDRRPLVLDEDGRDPWDQQTKESATQYGMFVRYADMPVRSAPSLARALGKSVAYVTQCAWAGRWRDRAEKRDAARAVERAARMRAESERVVDQWLALARGMLAKSAAALQSLRPEDMKPGEIARMVETATKIQRAALDMPDTTVALTGRPGAGPLLSVVPRSEGERVERLAKVAAELTRRGGDVDPAVFDVFLGSTGTG